MTKTRTVLSGVAAAAASTMGLDAAAADDKSLHLFNIIALKPEAKDDFIPVMKANAHGSRAEDGNISFDVFVDPDHPDTLLLFESWKSQDALDAHMKEPHLQAVGSALEEYAADGPQISHRLSTIPALPGYQRADIAAPEASRNVIVRFEVKPDSRSEFLNAFAETIPQARNAPGNILFDLYQVEDNPTGFVLYERWSGPSAHEAHLAQDYSAMLDSVLDSALAQPVERYQPVDIITE